MIKRLLLLIFLVFLGIVDIKTCGHLDDVMAAILITQIAFGKSS